MATIYLPCFAANEKDVENMVGILKNAQQKYDGFEVGLEIGGRAGHFTTEEGLGKIVDNIKNKAGEMPVVVHGFSGLDVYELDGRQSHLADMSRAEGAGLLDTYIDLAENIGSHYVHVHGGVGYRGGNTPEEKKEVLRRVRENLLRGLEKASEKRINIGIENLPSPSCCDFETNPDMVWRDYFEGIADVLSVVGETDLKATFDTSHYALNKKNFDLVEGAKKLGRYLYHIHIGDIQGFWGNGGLSYDGVIPGDGGIGNKRFADGYSLDQLKFISRSMA